MPTHEAAILSEARRVARLMRARTALKRRLREVDDELRLARRNLRALVGRLQKPLDIGTLEHTTPPLHCFGEDGRISRP